MESELREIERTQNFDALDLLLIEHTRDVCYSVARYGLIKTFDYLRGINVIHNRPALCGFWRIILAAESDCRLSLCEIFKTAATYGNLDFIKHIYNTDIKDAPISAMKSHNLDIIKFVLLKAQLTNSIIYECLCHSIYYEDLPAIEYLTSKYVFVDIQKAFEIACSSTINIVKLLHERYQSIELNDKMFRKAVESGKLEIVKYIWEASNQSIDLHAQNNVLFELAENYDMLKYLWRLSNFSPITIDYMPILIDGEELTTIEVRKLILDITLYSGLFEHCNELAEDMNIKFYRLDRINALRRNFQPNILATPKNIYFTFN